MEKILKGGQNTTVIKIGNSVHRTMSSNSQFVHEILQFLEKKNYKYSPRYLGIDPEGREVLSFFEGETGHSITWTKESLIQVITMMRELHDTTFNTDLSGKNKVICHRDIAPWNIIFLNNQPVGFIDFDGAEPGSRTDDLAYFIWTALEVGARSNDQNIFDKIIILCKSYGEIDPEKFITSLVQEQRKVLKHRKYLAAHSDKQELQIFSRERVNSIEADIQWVENNRKILLSNF